MSAVVGTDSIENGSNNNVVSISSSPSCVCQCPSPQNCTNNPSYHTIIYIDQHHVLHPYTSMTNPLPMYPVKSAKGVHLTLNDGQTFIVLQVLKSQSCEACSLLSFCSLIVALFTYRFFFLFIVILFVPTSVLVRRVNARRTTI